MGSRWEFRHQLIQEYYAAEWLLERVGGLGDGELKREFLNFLKWTEPVALMLALVEEEALAVRVVRLGLEVDLMLGARLAGEVKPQFQAQTVGFVDALEVPEWLKVELLGKTRSEFAVPPLLKLVEDSASNIGEGVVQSLNKINSTQAILGLIKLVKHSNSNVRACVAELLGKIGSIEAISGLLKLVEDSDPCVFGSVIVALHSIANAEAIPALLKLAEHSKFPVRRSAAWTLGEIGSAEAVPALLKLVEDFQLSCTSICGRGTA